MPSFHAKPQDGRLWHALWTVKNRNYLFNFSLFGSIIEHLFSAASNFSFKILILLPILPSLGLCCPWAATGAPHLLAPACGVWGRRSGVAIGFASQYHSTTRLWFRTRIAVKKSKKGKNKVVLMRALTLCWPSEVHSLLTSTLEWCDWSESRPGCFRYGKEPQVPTRRRLGGPQNLSGRLGEEIEL